MFINYKFIGLILLLSIGVYQDLRTHKINNYLVLCGIIFTLIMRIQEDGMQGIIFWSIGTMFPIGLLFILFLFKALGAGDIKLFAVVGGLYGRQFVLKTILLAFLIAGIMSVFHLIKYKQVFYRIHYFLDYIHSIIKYKVHYKNLVQQNISIKLKPYYDVNTEGYNAVIYFSVAILIGVIICGQTYL